jgi:NAD(P)-dependent dehydrogenase (short-subunit alcohol dehydrogenase family)
MAKVALVTGGAQGIGKSIVSRFLKAGYAVAYTDWDAFAGRVALREFEPAGDVRFVRADSGSERDVKRAVALVRRTWGRCDALINNAGVSRFTPFDKMTLREWDRVVRTDLTGAFLFCLHTAPLLRRTGSAIVNIASVRALMSEPGNEAYAAAKGGILGLTQALSISLGPAVRVNAICPGWIDVTAWQARPKKSHLRPIDHAQHPAGRVGRPDDIAQAALFLCDPDNGFLTGANLVIDGGMLRKMQYAE